MGMPGLSELLENIAALWKADRSRIEKNCAGVMESLRQLSLPVREQAARPDLIEMGFSQLDTMYDVYFGGFGISPKFPMPGNLSFLLRYYKDTGNRRALEMVDHSLRNMRRGGIWDHLGGGFHRYSVDRQWLAPHFEKMLYDQALIASTCIDAFRITGNRDFLDMAEEIFSFVLRDLSLPGGGFYSALDADSEGVEGKYYLWAKEEITSILGEKDGEFFCRYFGAISEGNWEGANILHMPSERNLLDEGKSLIKEDAVSRLNALKHKMMAVREERIKPLRDEKVITAWNGLMIAALSEGYRATGEKKYRIAAEEGVDFINRNLVTPEGRLLRSCHDGTGSIPGFLEDYSFLGHGLLALYDATLSESLLAEALRLTREMLRLFRDNDSGGLYDTGTDVEEVLLKCLDAADNVMPSANAIAAGNLVRLGRITGDDELLSAGNSIIDAFVGHAGGQPAGYLQLLSVMELSKKPALEITLVGRNYSREVMEILNFIGMTYLPGLVLRFEDSKKEPAIARVCIGYSCLPSADSVEGLKNIINEYIPGLKNIP
jgi:uncharacterized protein YyaL (SSP411 family)